MSENADDADQRQPSSGRSTTPRRHHYIPQMIQRRFAGPDLHLFSFDKRHPERGVERKPIRRLFQAQHLYTVRHLDGTRDTSTETRLSVIEGRAGSVIARAVDDARAGRPTPWSVADRKALIDLLIAQFRRSPDLHQRVLLRPTAEEIVADGIAQWEARFGPAPPEERAALLSPAFIAEARRNALAANAADPLLRVAAAMEQRGFSVARIAVPGCSFILGSNPFARFRAADSGRQDLGDPDAELWLPIAHDVALVSYGDTSTTRFVEFTKDTPIRQMNGLIARDSTVFASADRDLIEALARQTIRRTR